MEKEIPLEHLGEPDDRRDDDRDSSSNHHEDSQESYEEFDEHDSLVKEESNSHGNDDDDDDDDDDNDNHWVRNSRESSFLSSSSLLSSKRKKFIISSLPYLVVLIISISMVSLLLIVRSNRRTTSSHFFKELTALEQTGTPQDEIVWSEQDQKYHEYTWGPYSAHYSLDLAISGLSDAENVTRKWLLDTRTQAMAGVGIGVSQSNPPEPIRPPTPVSRPRGLPEADEGPGDFRGGDYQKYADLLQEWQSGKRVQMCPKGNWEDDYTKLHAEMMRGERPPAIVEYWCQHRSCGGLADRMLGIVSLFLYGILTNRAFTVSWSSPVPFDMIFDSAHIDWSQRYDPGDGKTSPEKAVYTEPSLLDIRQDFNFINMEIPPMDEFFPNALKTWPETVPAWDRFSFNRGVAIRSFYYPNVSEALYTLGFRQQTVYTCLINYLFRPKKSTLNFTNLYSSFFSLPSVFTIGIQIRTGDLSMYSAEADKVNTVERHSRYFTCAEQVAHAYAHKGQKVVYLIITDSPNLQKDAVDRYPGKALVSGLHSAHMEIIPQGSEGAPTEFEKEANGMMNTIAENYLLAETDFQILTALSGFGKIPTWLRGKPGSTIQVFNPYITPGAPEPQNCGIDRSLRSFSDLASGWSLG